MIRLGMLVGSLFVVLPIMAQQENGPDSKIRELQTRRIQTLQELSELLSVKYRQGQCSIRDVLAAKHDLLEAQLEIADRRDQRIQVLQSQLKLAKQTAEVTRRMFEAGVGGKTDRLRAQAAMYAIEIKLLRERAKAK